MLPELAEAFRLQQAGRLDDAEAAYAKLLARDPDDPVALINAGALALARDDVAAALDRLERAVAHVPRNAIAQNNLGFAQIRAARFAAALTSLDRAVAQKPDYAQAHNNRGIALVRLARPADARAAFERALACDPALVDAAVNLGDALADAGDGEAALRAYDAALGNAPGNAAARRGRAFALALTGDLARAAAALDAAVAAHPDDAAAWQTLGAVANWAWDHERAETAFRRAAALAPASDDARFGIASTLLARGRFRDGFTALEQRPAGVRGEVALMPYPIWTGDMLAGTLLLHGEQGFGDVIQFARFIAAARARVARIVVLVDGYLAPLAPLLRTCAGVDAVTTNAADVGGAIEARASILSLPHLLGIAVADLPGRIPYLKAPEDARATWAARVARWPAPRIGLAWSVAARDAHGYAERHKSVPRSVLAPLLQTPDAAFVSLQPGAAGDPAAFGASARRIEDVRGDLVDFGATAALIGSLDLVIAADTAVAHLAGALGIPVWLLDRYNACWRWRLAADRSPWYPSMTILRQTEFGVWADVAKRLDGRFAAWRRERRRLS